MNAHDRFSRRSFLIRGSAAAFSMAGGALSLRQEAQVAAQAGDYELVSDYDGVRVRNAPGLHGAVIGVVNTGGVVSVTGETVFADGYSWVPVFVHDQVINGYVAGEFFRNASGSTGWFRGTPVHVTSNSVNLRSGAGLGYSVIASYDNGTPAMVNDGPRTADGYDWYNITFWDGTTGWMAADFLAPGDTGVPRGWVPGRYVMTTSDLNLRSGAGLGYGVIRTYGVGQTATILDGPTPADGYDWYRVEVWDSSNTIGWFASEFLETARFEPTGARHEVVDGPLNLREWGSLSAPVITTIPTGGVFVIADASFGSADGYTWAMVYLEDDPSVTGSVALGFSVEI